MVAPWTAEFLTPLSGDIYMYKIARNREREKVRGSIYQERYREIERTNKESEQALPDMQ